MYLRNDLPESVDLLSFQCLRPTSYLKPFVAKLLLHRIALIEGPKGCGKSQLARQISRAVTGSDGQVLTSSDDLTALTCDNKTAGEDTTYEHFYSLQWLENWKPKLHPFPGIK